ncbi:AI-2E family transporter [Ignavigranum ruoffiae]|uniref:AI-2E family transporter n=1 Tax=Ignavigranum ruoffiae TaxID=89093 RepID=UPI0020478DE6|nr:AI-2E family transporter [Ignavigranum ruoffiae]UPQ85290.1 AI-2E family transporter [Ignavigranum ruoffiae]
MNPSQKESKKPFVDRLFSNKTIVTLFGILIFILIIFLLTQISYLFSPLGQLFSIIGFPIIGAGVLYYLFIPMIEKMEVYGVKRQFSIWIIFLVIIILLVWGSLSLFPVLQNQTNSFIENLPFYIEQFGNLLEDMRKNSSQGNSGTFMNNILESIDLQALGENLNQMITRSIENIGGVIGTVTQVVAGLVTIPVVLYYLLLQGQNVPNQLIKLVPSKQRDWFKRVLYNCNYQISQYIRGQIMVAIIVGIMFAILYAIIGLDYGISLAVLAGILNVIPYLGSIISFIPAFFIALFMGHMMVFKFLIAVMVEQTIEGRIVAPQVLGNNLQIHPVTILFILLGAGKLFGLTGVILGVPIYAVIKVIVKELFVIYQVKSGLYDESDIIGVNHEQTSKSMPMD